MMDPSYALIGALVLFFIIASGVVLLLWIALPFSVFGTKDLLKKLIEEQEKTNKLLFSIQDSIRSRENVYKDSGDFPEKRDSTH